MNIHSSLIAELREKAYREAYVASQIKIGLPFQTRALRQSRGWTQDELAAFAGMAQPRIAEIEKPGERRLNLETLLRLASAFDVGLEVRFVPFSELVDRSEAFDPDNFAVKPFNEELSETEAKEQQEKVLAVNVGEMIAVSYVAGIGAGTSLADLYASSAAALENAPALNARSIIANETPGTDSHTLSLIQKPSTQAPAGAGSLARRLAA